MRHDKVFASRLADESGIGAIALNIASDFPPQILECGG